MGSSARWIVVAALSLASSRIASGEPPPESPPASPPTAPSRLRHTLYVEFLGKGGLWGLGYSYQLTPRLALGVVASLSAFDNQRMWSASPSVTVYPLGTRRHRAFLDLGPQLVHVSTPSPVPEWMGTSSTGIGGQLSAGYEHRGRVLVRAFGMGVVGKGGIAPWAGVDMGCAF